MTVSSDGRRARPFVVLRTPSWPIAIVTVLASGVFLSAFPCCPVEERRATVAILRLIQVPPLTFCSVPPKAWSSRLPARCLASCCRSSWKRHQPFLPVALRPAPFGVRAHYARCGASGPAVLSVPRLAWRPSSCVFVVAAAKPALSLPADEARRSPLVVSCVNPGTGQHPGHCCRRRAALRHVAVVAQSSIIVSFFLLDGIGFDVRVTATDFAIAVACA